MQNEEAAFNYYARLARVREHFERHYSGDTSLAAAAAIAGMERRYFSAFFRAKTGVCYKDWIQRIRIERAVALIENGNRGLAEVALKVGYDDVRSFQRAFKKQTGMTARDYKLTRPLMLSEVPAPA